MSVASDDIPECPKCGQRHERNGRRTCKAHSKRGENGLRPCKGWPVEGAEVCRFHGGAAPQVQAAARARVVQAHMDQVLKYAIGDVERRHLDKSADEQLLEEVGRSAQAVEWLAMRVAELHVPDPSQSGDVLEDLISVDDEGNPVTRPNRFSLYGPTHTGDLGVHPLLTLLNQERDRHARMAKLAIDAGISERLVRLAESQAHQIVAVIVAVIDTLPLDAGQREDARRVAADKLRALGPVPVVVPARTVGN